MLISKFLFSKRLNSKIIYLFNVENYGKPLNPLNISRLHSRFRYDENAQIKEDKNLAQEFLTKEKNLFDSILPKITEVNKYFKTSEQRKDTRIMELPERYENYDYFSKFATLQETNDYEIIWRKNRNTNKEELVIDIKEIPFVTRKYWKTVRLAKIALSDDHRYVSFCLDLENNENYIIGVKDIQENKYMKSRIKNSCNMRFDKENKGLYIIQYNDKMRSNKVMYHDFLSNKEKLIYEENDEQFYVDLTVSKDKKYFIISSATKQISEIYVIDRNDKDLNKIKLISRNNNCRAFCNHAEGYFYILTDMNGVYDYKIVRCSDDQSKKIGLIEFEDFFLPKTGQRVKDLDLFKNHIVLYLENEGLTSINIVNLSEKSSFSVDLEENCAEIAPGLNENYETARFRFHVDTPLIYNRIYEYDILTKKLELLEDFKMGGPKFDQNKYITKRLNVPTLDGELVPLTLIHKKSIKLNRKNKLLLHGYGSYGVSLDIGFNIVNLAALENDWILAFAHVRGGNEKGWNWHESATKFKKINSFKDFIHCAEFLIAEKYTHPSLLCAYGSSAGGLLIGTVINMRPELFKAVVLNVPYLDILNALTDKNLPLTTSDYEEFGNPVEDQKIYDFIWSYSPYENITEQEYPFIYITMGTEDFRAPGWAVLKFTQRFRQKAKDSNLIEKICDKNILVNPIPGGHYGENSILANIWQKSLYFGVLDHVLKKSKDIKEIE